MDSLPEADTDAVRATIDELQHGLALVPHAQAVARIDAWHRMLSTSDRDDLQQIAGELARLKSQLLRATPDGDEIGSLLSRLGAQTVAAARHAERDAVGRAVERLANLLLHTGHALRGPRPVPSS